MNHAGGIHPSRPAFDYLRRLVYDASAIVLDDNKDYLFESRLRPILRREGLPTFEELVRRLGTGPGPLRQQVIEAMTTNETSFFRDLHPFDALSKVVFPALAQARAAERTLTIWSAAASTGQEIYSIAMLLKECARFSGWNLRLSASDLSTEVLARARVGRYSQLEVNRGLPVAMLLRHFEKVGAEWQIKDDLRRMVEFKILNLIEAFPPMPAMDIIFLRNVLIYFDVDVKRRVLERLARVMRPGGYLFLGGVESTLNLNRRFTEVQIGKATCYRLSEPGV